jgi:hypothetical protein
MPLQAQLREGEDCPHEKTMVIQKKLDSLAVKNFEANRIQGFRIQLYSGNNREEAGHAKELIYQLFPKADVYTNYQAPTFKVRFGDFYSRIDAWQHLLKLQGQFPSAVITSEIVIIKP